MVEKLVEIRTWPQETDLRVIDVFGARQIAHYPAAINNRAALTAASDPLQPYQQRAAAARELLQEDQEFLRLTFDLDDDQIIELKIDDTPRQLAAEVLAAHQLSFADLELVNTKNLVERLDNHFSSQELFELLLAWHDVVELHRHENYSQGSGAPWVERSSPENCFLFHYLADNSQQAVSPSSSAAADIFGQMIDLPASNYSFGILLRWLYYWRVEFPDRPRRPLRAWQELKIAC